VWWLLLFGVAALLAERLGHPGYAVLLGALALAPTAIRVHGWLGGGARASSGRMMVGHGHGGARAQIIEHEAGHIAAGRRLGGRETEVRVSDTEGYVSVELPPTGSLAGDVQADVTFWLAGAEGARSSAGAGHDRDLAAKRLRDLPPSERGAVRRAAQRDARAAGRSSQQRAAARDLTRKFG
jgi:hypothetical protein